MTADELLRPVLATATANGLQSERGLLWGFFQTTHPVQVADKLPINFHDGDMRGIGQELKGITAAAGDKVAGALGAVNAATNSLVRVHWCQLPGALHALL